MHIVIFAGGTVQPGSAVNTALARAAMVIAADNGAVIALRYGFTPAIVVGDFDSLTIPRSELEAKGCRLISAAVEKNETDTELAVQIAIEQGANEITILGATGGARFDHTIANILLLAGVEAVPLRIVDGPMTCWLLRGPGSTTVTGSKGDLLSLFPLTTDATGIRTTGLYYPLHDETLFFGRPRGVSNALTDDKAEVTLEHGMLLIIHTNKRELKE
ncbi:MAG TPA: thiamine diphosphokinase [Ktedonobacter sp.]|nr:thiamine diphosphokinase [Ktedonobacter sp.]